MKNIFLFLFTLFTITIINAQTNSWSLQNSGTKSDLSSVYFTDSNKGFIVSKQGIILKTIDGGKNWTKCYSNSKYILGSISFPNAKTGYVIAGLPYLGGDFILKTTDSGTTWTEHDLGTKYGLSLIYFNDTIIGYAIGINSIIMETSNGGTTWSKHYLDPTDSTEIFSSILFINKNSGYVVGGGGFADGEYGIIFKTNNGGTNWIRKDIGAGLYSIYFLDSITGYAVGWGGDWFYPYGIIFKTTDGGATWKEQNSGTKKALNSVHFTDINTGYAVGDSGIILKTTNGGIDWGTQYSGTTTPLNSVYFTNSNNGYIVGNNSTILKTTNGGGAVSLNQSISTSPGIKAYPNPTTSNLFLEIPQTSKQSQITIYNISGQQILTQQISSPKTELDICYLKKGIYLLKFTDNKSSEMIKIIKE